MTGLELIVHSSCVTSLQIPGLCFIKHSPDVSPVEFVTIFVTIFIFASSGTRSKLAWICDLFTLVAILSL